MMIIELLLTTAAASFSSAPAGAGVGAATGAGVGARVGAGVGFGVEHDLYMRTPGKRRT